MKKRLFSLVLLILATTMLFAGTIVLTEDYGLKAAALSSSEEITEVEFLIGSFNAEEVMIAAKQHFKLSLAGGAFTAEKGEPQLPTASRSVIIPNRVKKDVVFVEGTYKEFKIDVIPSKGLLYRYEDPSVIPYEFGEVYQKDTFYPGKLTELSEPFIMRDYRGQTVTVYPFQYNPVTGVLRVYERMVVKIVSAGESDINVFAQERNVESKEFIPLYQSMFLNYPLRYRYPVLDELGRMIVISADRYAGQIQPFVDWKNERGLLTELYLMSEIGTTAGEVKNFIQEQYDLDDGLVFVQLVGNGFEVPTYRVRTAAADPEYSLLAGNDNYPDIFVGRFSALDNADVATQVQRSIYYERDMPVNANWLLSGVGIASAEGQDIQHMNEVRQILLDGTYSAIDQIYPPNATAQRVREAVNEGRGLINYAGHGRGISWSTTGLSVTSVRGLTNDNKLPLVFSVACQNGNFIDNVTCFAEAWLRSVNGQTGQPIGGIGFYGSSANQLWDPPLIAQQEAADLISAQRMFTMGGIFFNSSSRMIQQWGVQGATEFKNWIIFGDVSLQVRTEVPEEMVVVRSAEVFIGDTVYQVNTNVPDALVAISYESEFLAGGYTGEDGNITLEDIDFPLRPALVDITITAPNYATYRGTVEIIPNEGPYIIIDSYRVSGQRVSNVVEYGETAKATVALKNVGTITANEVNTRIYTNDKYVTVIDSVGFYDIIDPSEVVEIEEAFTLKIADNIPNRHLVVMNMEVTDAEETVWNWRFSFYVNAPKLTTGIMILDDSQFGNSNGKLDPGETVVLTIPLLNTGDAITKEVMVNLISGSDLITIVSDDAFTLHPIKVGETVYPTFTLTADEDAPAGSILPIGFAVTAGRYVAQRTYKIPIGAVAEDFESGDFNTFDWQFSGNLPWTIDETNAFRGNYSARSGNIAGSQTSAMSVSLEVTEPGNISFFRRVSSEMNYDFLNFYINGQVKGQWSGEVPWGQVSYEITNPGIYTFKWEYRKDVLIDQGYDSAWIDEIQFPALGLTVDGAIAGASSEVIDFGAVPIGTTKDSYLYLRNFGNREMTGTIELPEGYFIKTGSNVSNHHRNGYTESFDYSVGPESSIEITVLFEPEEAVQYVGDMAISANAINRNQLTVRLTGSGFVLSTEEDLITPLVTALGQNYPNPFNPATTISFSLSANSHVSLEVFNIKGQRIATLIDEKKGAGRYSVVWNGTNASEGKAASGVYFYRMKTEDYESVKRMLYLK